MLGVRLDLGFTLSKEKSLLELVQKALNSVMLCLTAVESVFADAEPLVRALHLLPLNSSRGLVGHVVPQAVGTFILGLSSCRKNVAQPLSSVRALSVYSAWY